MRNIKLFDSPDHQFILLNESDPGEENGIRSNQYLIMHNGEGILLDPGGYGVMPRVLSEMMRYVEPKNIKAVILSHQDPDIVAGLATWIEVTTAPIYISRIWTRFIPHYGIKDIKRFVGVPDCGMALALSENVQLQLIPAHFLHSEGQMNVYDPISKILFSGDIGAAAVHHDKDYFFVEDFKAHLHYIEWFHKRYMCSNRAARIWIENIAQFDINLMAPQHGPIYCNQAVSDFIAWFQTLECGVDLMKPRGEFNLDLKHE